MGNNPSARYIIRTRDEGCVLVDTSKGEGHDEILYLPLFDSDGQLLADLLNSHYERAQKWERKINAIYGVLSDDK